MKRKLLRRRVILLVLVLLNLAVYFSGPGNSKLSFDPFAYTLRDIGSLRGISLARADQVNSIRIDEKGNWILNDTFRVDADIRRVFHQILTTMEIRRPLSAGEIENLESRMEKEGCLVRITGGKGLTYRIVDNPVSTRTFLVDTLMAKGYEMEIPGYHHNFSVFFRLTQQQWRDRVIYRGNWRTIKSVTVDYRDSGMQDLKLVFLDGYFVLSPLPDLEVDQELVNSYMGQFKLLRVNERILEETFPAFRRLLLEEPEARLTVADIRSTGFFLDIFRLPEGDSVRLLRDFSGELMVLEARLARGLLKSPADFQVRDTDP